ncbi:hypothetical protein THSYN_31225 (plasmid) [Candidatus Thiodictyon syntrophicum]|uniref:Uncharacterized protein n=1 Tax=Candidatus Thiodictyon syntrophicum TaxID=1166950 RepID=A0A2K8UIP8_9GAMM|nr:hypothetical protein THSYN_31225 [Candidatus Thiodictyon syntrophicum]
MVDNLSGQVAFEFFNEPNGFGLYNEDAVPTETAKGGAAALSAQFAQVSTLSTPMPSVNPTSVECPADFNPALLTPGSVIGIRAMNYASQELLLSQSNEIITRLPQANTNGDPSVTAAKIDAGQELWILDLSYNSVCTVQAGQISEGATVRNNVAWGQPCNTSQ